MTKIDLKDRKILYELDLNCRQSNTQIGKKVGLKKDVVAYRIKRMQDGGIIRAFWTAIDTFKLGYDVFRIYINFQYVGSEIKQKIIDHFTSYPNVWAVISLKGDIDFDVVVWVKDTYEFYRFWDNTLDKFEDYFAKYTISIYVEGFDYKKTYLIEDYDETDRFISKTICGGKPIKIDETDYQLLNEIAVNARIPLIELAGKLGISSQAVKYRLKNLMKNEIICAFRVDIDLQQLGLERHKLEIYLKDHTKRKLIWNYVKEKSYCEELNVAIGWSDLEFGIVVENIDKINEIIDDLYVQFPNSIKKTIFWWFMEVHKERWIPEL